MTILFLGKNVQTKEVQMVEVVHPDLGCVAFFQV